MNKSNIINGKIISQEILNNIREEIFTYKNFGKPGLSIIQIGNKSESTLYIKKKKEACEYVGINVSIYNFAENVPPQEVINLIEHLNKNEEINGIIIQLPIPQYLNEKKILEKINIYKDVDGFSSYNIGNLALEGRNPLFIPCTPLGCMELLKREEIEIQGKNIVILGKSNLVGLPMALLLLKELGTVSICNKKSENIQYLLKNADIVISACGIPEFIKKEWLKENVVIIDIGINIIHCENSNNGKKIVGDVDFNNVKTISKKITPVPGGVGPMTVAMLLQNTLKSFKIKKKILKTNI